MNNIVADPALAAKVLSEFDTANELPVASAAAEGFHDLEPSDTTVVLPLGTREIDRVEIRELNGIDEEAMAKVPSIGKVLLTVIQRAVVSVGVDERKPTQDDLDSLWAGDRDYILLKIRALTWGPEIKYNIRCGECGTDAQVTLDVDEIEVKTLDDLSQAYFEVPLRKGVAKVSLPTGYVQREIINAGEKTTAELNTVLLRNCVREINGEPVISDRQVQALSIADREKIGAAISERNVGPVLSGIKVNCPDCDAEMEVAFTLADLFRL